MGLKNKYTFFLSGWTEIESTSEEEARRKVDRMIESFTNISVDSVEVEETKKEEESTSTGPYMEKNPSPFTETFKDSGKEDGIGKMM